MKYFIDTNVIIDLLGNNQSQENKKESKEEQKNRKKEAQEIAQKKLEAIILEEDSELFINRLIIMETLRTIHFDHKRVFREAEEKLSFFRQLDIRPKIYENAVKFSRFCHSKGIKLKGKCEAIDFLHFITAKYYKLKIISNDGDMPKLEDAYVKFLETQNA